MEVNNSLSWAVEIRKEDQNFVRQKGTKKKKEEIAAPAFLFKGEKVADEEKRASSSPSSRGGRRSRNQLPWKNNEQLFPEMFGNWQAVDLELHDLTEPSSTAFVRHRRVAVDMWGCLLLQRWRILTTRISVMRDVSAPFFILKEAATSNTSLRKMKQASLLPQPESNSN